MLLAQVAVGASLVAHLPHDYAAPMSMRAVILRSLFANQFARVLHPRRRTARLIAHGD
jgi:hypothetical protein